MKCLLRMNMFFKPIWLISVIRYCHLHFEKIKYTIYRTNDLWTDLNSLYSFNVSSLFCINSKKLKLFNKYGCVVVLVLLYLQSDYWLANSLSIVWKHPSSSATFHSISLNINCNNCKKYFRIAVIAHTFGHYCSNVFYKHKKILIRNKN